LSSEPNLPPKSDDGTDKAVIPVDFDL
jgi:hypothetical protein